MSRPFSYDGADPSFPSVPCRRPSSFAFSFPLAIIFFPFFPSPNCRLGFSLIDRTRGFFPVVVKALLPFFPLSKRRRLPLGKGKTFPSFSLIMSALHRLRDTPLLIIIRCCCFSSLSFLLDATVVSGVPLRKIICL